MKFIRAYMTSDFRSKMILFISAMLLLFVTSVSGQSSYNMIKDGNKQFKEKKFSDAEVNYRRSINTGKNLKEGNYNLGNAYYKEGKYEQAAQQFQSVSGMKSLSAEEQAKTYHNLGNSLLKENKFEESIQAYKNALKLNPNDNETRYNLAYAQAKLQQQQQQQNKDNKDKKDDKNKDQKNKDQQKQDQKKDQKKDDKQNQDQNKEQEQKDKEQKDKQQQARKNNISKEDAEKILQALNNDEKKTQKKMNLKQPTKVSIVKQW